MELKVRQVLGFAFLVALTTALSDNEAGTPPLVRADVAPDAVLASTFCNGNSCNQSLDLSLYPGENCYRPCVAGRKPLVCYFKFVLENYQAMGAACGNCSEGVEEDCRRPQCVPADGVERGIMSINRGLAANHIHVCQNDRIVVDVENHMGGSSSTIHWHGPHQRETPYMDGVPFVTQCPIEYSTGFRYSFWAREPGTQFFHSHAGHHKVNGIFGALIIRRSILEEPNAHLYDYDLPDHTLFVVDWMHDMAEMFWPGNPTRQPGIRPSNILINGNGRFTDPKTGKTTKTPLHVFTVKEGYRYRFRFINSASHVCGMQVQIEGHNMAVLASDSYDVHDIDVQTLISNSGERYDFVVNANQPARDYWIRVRAIGPCESQQIEQFAILRYETYGEPELGTPPSYDAAYPEGAVLNKQTTDCNNPPPNEYCITNLRAHNIDQELRTSEPDHKFYLTFNNYRVEPEQVFQPGNYDHFMNVGGKNVLIGGINSISLVFPPFPVLTQPEDISEDMFCDEGSIPSSCAGKLICPCIHRLKVNYSSIVELVITDETERRSGLTHPFHLHGHGMTVTRMGRHPDGIPMTRSLYQHMEMTRSLPPQPEGVTPPYKDTISIPSKGYIVVRFRANNRGFWLMHCHFDWHMAVGMAFILQVGETQQMAKPPKNFPKCGNFKPDVYDYLKNV